MKDYHRYGVQFILTAVLLPITLSSCILVVEDDYRDRRHLRGTDWYVEFVFYGQRTLAPADESIELSFLDDTRFSGKSACGAFSGTYSLNDADRLAVESVDSESGSCTSGGASALFLDELTFSRKAQIDNSALRIDTRGENYILLSDRTTP